MILKDKLQSGRSMIEMLGVLAIVGILSAGGIAGYSMAMQHHKTNTYIEKIQLIAQQIRTLYKGEYTGATTTELVNSGLVKDFKNPFGGNLGLYTTTTAFDIYNFNYNIPADACVKILTANWGERGVFNGIDVNGTWFRWDRNNTSYPISLTDAISVCGESETRIGLEFK